MNNQREYKFGDMLKLADTSVVSFVERGTSDNDVLIVCDRNGTKDIIREHQVRDHYRSEQNKAYARK